jgi:hypothetical protein
MTCSSAVEGGQRRYAANNVNTSSNTHASRYITFEGVPFDLQSMLQMPSSQVYKIFYTRELWVYILCICSNSQNILLCMLSDHWLRGNYEIGTAFFAVGAVDNATSQTR